MNLPANEIETAGGREGAWCRGGALQGGRCPRRWRPGQMGRTREETEGAEGEDNKN